MVLTIDEAFREVGEFHKFHWLMIILFGYTYFALASFPLMVVTFITAEPNWQCVKGYNSSICNFNKSIGLTSKHYKDRCDMPREAWTVEGFTSTVTEYDLVCDKSILQSVAQSCYWIGMLLGLLFAGYLSDRFGRKKIFIAGVIAITIATWIMIFPKSFIVFIVCRIIIGAGSGFRQASSNVMIIEMTTAKYRPKMGIFSFLFWVAGLLVLALIAYLIPDWRYMLLATACFAIPCLFILWFVPESIRWLQLHGKGDIARKQLEKVARLNGKKIPSEDLIICEDTTQCKSFKDLFFSLRMTKTTLICWNMTFANALVYYGVSYSSVDLGGNRYLNFALISLVELPSNLLCIVAVNKFGRKKAVIVAMLIAFFANIITVIIPEDRSNDGNTGARIFFALLAKFFINLSFSGSYIWHTELFPTCIRTMGIGTSSGAARIGSFAASYIVWLIRVHSILPYGIMGIICLQAAILAMFQPETKGKPTLETLDDTVANSINQER
ncbi:organic cation transporter protein-like [Xenia sp. Carnegie-2017]|uniref:organic cation transporter protein-like n=1 Tax=Xenia sp. Carnegie-2017 TaxID=2897299 RepID=UPI001F03775E|nr:organic cation transporter protein-like [Xenia sp. Carnegie-2017]